MKKKYKKPTIVLESFDVQDYVTACNLRDLTASPFTCAQPDWVSGDATLDDFWNSPDGFFTELICVNDFQDVYTGEYCYHVATGNNIIVGS